jgi:hypothetical protein
LQEALDTLEDDLVDIRNDISEQEENDEKEIRVDLTNLTHSIEDVYSSIDDNKDEYKDDLKDKYEDVKDFIINTTEEDYAEVKNLLTGGNSD